MAVSPTTPEMRACEACGSSFAINPRYSARQREGARYCSKSCSSRSRRPERAPISSFLHGVTRVGWLTFTGEEGAPISGGDHTLRTARFRCDCGQVRDIQPSKIVRGLHLSCGCRQAEIARANHTTHGGCYTTAYRSWNAMTQRCHNPKHISFPDYGGRGIVVCDRWREDFNAFLNDMGPRPAGTSIDRIDPNGNYEPGNCRWAANDVQASNRRSTRYLTVDGVTKTMAQWGAERGFSRNTISERLRDGWSERDAVVTPLGGKPGAV